jgi:hypothetical protein
LRKQIVERLSLGQEVRVALAGRKAQDRAQVSAQNNGEFSVIPKFDSKSAKRLI